MRIQITTIAKEDRGPVKRDLKKAFRTTPAVVITKTLRSRTSGTIPVTVSKGPVGKGEREAVAGAIDAVLMRHGYRFCNITHA